MQVCFRSLPTEPEVRAEAALAVQLATKAALMRINGNRIGRWAGFRRNPARNIAMLRPLILVGCLLAAPALAETAVLTIAQDRYEAGEAVRFDGPAVSDLFLAGNRVVVASPVGGSAHLARRRVTFEGPVSDDLFAVGYGVEVNGAVGADASATGYGIQLGPITGNLWAACIASYRDGLCCFLSDGRVKIESNIVVCTICPIALKRKNALSSPVAMSGPRNGRSWPC